jgi:putative aldouronate transport system permease protein
VIPPIDRTPRRNVLAHSGAAGPGRAFRAVRKHRALYLMFLPVAVYFLLFAYYPFLKGILMSFQANRILEPRPFVGIANYIQAVTDPDFWQALLNSLVIGLLDAVFYFVLSLLLALAINEVAVRPARKTVQTVAFIPFLLSWAVIGGVWALIFDQRGIVSVLTGLFGARPLVYLAEPGLARPLIIAMGIWRSIGYYAVMFMVAIVAVDPALFEAARMDGATRMQQIRLVIIPSLGNTAKAIAVLLAMSVLTHFDEMYVMQNAANKRLIRSLLLYVYETGILRFQTGLATAGAALVMAGSLLLVALTRRIVRYDA